MKEKIPTLIVIVASVAVLGICAWKHVAPETIAAIAAALVTLSGSMRGLMGPGSDASGPKP